MSRMKNVAALAVAAIVGGLLAGGTIAHASETMQIRFPSGSFAINPHTCKFVQPEADKPLGSSWATGRIWAAYEDGRHDAKAACNTARQTAVIACYATPIPPVDEHVDHQAGWADTRGVKAAVDAVRKIQACVLGVGGVSAP